VLLDQCIRYVRTRALLLAALCGVLVLSAPIASASAARTPTGSGGDKPTIVLVHGAWADGSSWSDVVRRLQRDGYPVRVPPNPLRSLPGDTATVVNFLSTISGPVVLVGHSYGGAVITNAAAGQSQVKALVYVNAFVPDEGESVAPLAGPDSALAADPTTVFDFVPYPAAPAGDVDLYLKRSVFLTSFAVGVPARVAAVLYATQRPITLSALNQPSGAPAWKTIPSWYLVGTQDRIIPPTQQRFMAQRAGARTVEIDAGHLSPITHSRAVERLILDAVRATR
jgi:pimeloyl-ACP methyl ester carboxylesterase